MSVLRVGSKFKKWSKWPREKHIEWVHPSLYQDKSTILNAGTGVFADRDLLRGTHLGFYVGDVYWTYPETCDRDFGYLMYLASRPPWITKKTWKKQSQQSECKGAIVDGTNMLAYMNCCNGTPLKPNCVFTTSGRFVVHQKIKANTELIIWYGENYWITANDA